MQDRAVIRINPLEQGELKDLCALRKLKPHAFHLPKVDHQERLHMALQRIPDEVELHFTVETARTLN
ncbi:hypothetical protein [Magnetococcus sp. PR-3]|uniref:hypothetical protein n=1 Tax=Magnetococcus sp. PR-3 TaxID=3120355 RepID=UPI002FCE3955